METTINNTRYRLETEKTKKKSLSLNRKYSPNY